MSDLTPKTEILRGELLEHRTFREHWGIAKVRIAGQAGGPATVTGKLLGCAVGDTIQLTGRWVTDAKYGKQFKATSAERLTPEGSAGMIKWIASRCPNVGEARARAMVERFGVRLWDVIENDPLELCLVDGITAQRAGAIAEAYDTYKGERDAMITLRDWGLTDNQVGQCVGRWGDLAAVIAKLQQDPYKLGAVDSFGFLRADEVAHKMGVARDAPARIAAGVEHVLAQGRQAGHCYIGGGKLQNMAASLLGVDAKAVGRAMRTAIESDRLVLRDWRVYTPRLEAAEGRVAERVRALLARGAAAANDESRGAA